jgi:hypothetical protein
MVAVPIRQQSLSSAAVQTVPISYIEADGTEKEVEAEIGQNLMEVAHKHNVELEGTTRIFRDYGILTSTAYFMIQPTSSQSECFSP